MGSSYFGEPNMGSESNRGSSSSSSTTTTRKSKKSGSDKPKQPQRGLGVAQLEKIRLHGQMGGCTSFLPNTNSLPHSPYHPHHPHNFTAPDDFRVQSGYSSIPSSSFSYSSANSSSSASYGFNPHFMMGLSEYDRASIRPYDDSQPTNTASWNIGSGNMEIPHYVQQPSMTRHLLNFPSEDLQEKKKKKHRSSSLGSSSQNSESNDNQDVDLELRLSL